MATTSNLTGLLDKIDHRVGEDGPGAGGSLTLGEILNVIGRRAYGPLLLIIGIMSVSPLALIPGSTWLFATLTLLVAAQMALNLKHPWLPKAALRVSFAEIKLSTAIRKVRPFTRTIDKLVKPRLQFLTKEPWIIPVALLAIAAALVTFPLSFVPFAPFLPGATVILIGLGVTARDGIVLGLAVLLATGCAVWLASWLN